MIKPGMIVRVIDDRATTAKIGEVGVVLCRPGCDPDNGQDYGWVVKFSFSWRRLGWTSHLFAEQLEVLEVID